MAKYYVQDGYEQVIQEADTPPRTCALAVLNKFTTFVVNGVYKVSERGFDSHDQAQIHSDLVMKFIWEYIQNDEI